jgi:hypothetical protein
VFLSISHENSTAKNARGAGEPVWNLKWNTHHEQKALRDEKRLAKKIDTGITQMN